MKFAAFLVLSLSAMALAGPAFNTNNQIQSQDAAAYKQQQQQQQQQYMTDARSPTIDILKQWCFSSQMSQKELTNSFKKLVQAVKASPNDQTTESAVMNERICHGANQQDKQQQQQRQQQQQQQQQQTGFEATSTGADPQAHELIKDVYMDALISANTREATSQLVKIVQSQKVDSIRASYYMTRIAVADKQSINDEQDVKQFAEDFIQEQQQHQHQPQHQKSEAIERQKLFATTSLIGKWIAQKPQQRQQIAQVAQKVAEEIVERYIKPVSQQEVEQYKQTEQPSQEAAKKIAKRNAALKALANIPGHVLKQSHETEQTLAQLAQNKQELVTVRQSAIEALEQNDKQMQLLKQLAFDQQEPIEVRVAAYRALMTTAYAGDENKQQQQKQQIAEEIVELVVKHCESQQNQQQDDQFVLYAISHLDNMRTSQQPEHQAIKETIAANKQHYMQIQVLSKKFKQQLSDVRRSSRNYKLEQEFNQLESGLVLEGDLIYESKQKQQQQYQQQPQILPKVVRVNMSMPIMGETVNVVEITLRQNQMDEEVLSALKMATESTKFNTESISKMVDSFKSSVQRQQQQQQQQQYQQQQQKPQQKNQYQQDEQQVAEADLTIKVDGRTVVYLCVDDFKAATSQKQQQQQHQRNTRSIYSSNSIVDEAIEYLKRQPVAFNRGFNLNINERLAKVIDVDANILAGLRFESRAQGNSKDDFEIVAQMEPRFSFEAIVGPAKMSSKKLLQRASTKTALGLRLRYKKNQLVDVQVDLPMNSMELFTVETQLVEKSTKSASYNYLPESIYGQEDIYSAAYPSEAIFADEAQQDSYANKLAKRSIAAFGSNKKSTISQLFKTKGVAYSYETSPRMAADTGLSAKLRVAASPKDMSLLVSAKVDKYEPQMQGYRVKIEQTGGRTSADAKSYLVTVSTPGSRFDRTMQARVTAQTSQQRTLVKAEVSSPRMGAGISAELVHDGRQFSAKTEIVTRNQQQQQQSRHSAEFGVITSAQSAAGRLASFSCKPYLQLDSTALKRPVQLQGQMAYVQAPKSVISYELKSSSSGNFVQGKLIVDQRSANQMQSMQMRKRSSMPFRRSMQSPIELIATKDLTITNEFIAQIEMHAVKVHNMLDWDCQKYSLQGDASASYKNMRKQNDERQLTASMKIDEQQQTFTLERKSQNDERKQFAARVESQVRPNGHQMEAECRYNGRRQSVVAYKHKVEVQKQGANKYDAQLEVELVDTERQIAEKVQGRARVLNERKTKQAQLELASATKKAAAKLSLDFQSGQQHQAQMFVQTSRFQHKTEMRNSQRQLTIQSRTEQPASGKVWAKVLVDVQKQQPAECKIVIEAPTQRASVAADLKLAPGKRSSVAVQSGRFSSQAEFAFELSPSKSASRFYPFERSANLFVRSNLKDLANKQAYWMDSQINTERDQESYFRFDSPYYRTELEYDPRAQEAKLGAFARAKRSADQFDSDMSARDAGAMFGSLLGQASDKLQLGPSKMWMLRSVLSSPFARDQLKQKARRALFEYADRRQAHKHQFGWAPADERINMDFAYQPNTDFVSSAEFEPIRMKADLSTACARPSSMSLASEWVDIDFLGQTANDDDDSESFAKLTALSRHRRSAFKKHESEIRHKKDDGYKAWAKHQDADGKRHEMRFQSAESPKQWAQMNYDSDKHGKGSWEHHWRQHQKKRAADQQECYQNKFALKCEGPDSNKWAHETSFEFEEPVRMAGRRHRRSATDARYPFEYLAQTSARLSSSHRPQQQQQPQYKLDFDYQPQANFAAFNMDMADDMQHAASLELKPAQRLFKLESKLYNRRTNQPSYQLTAATKPHAEQEPAFVHSSHPMLERPIDADSLAFRLLQQPLKINYSDKYGRMASFDYDEQTGAAAGAGLRPKRAAVYYKDNVADFEHNASYDFYPEALLAKAKPAFYGQAQSPVAIKTNTKYGPIVVRADASDDATLVELQSPLMSAKLVGQTGANMRKLYTVQADNKAQRVQMAKLVRELAPAAVRDSKTVKKIARQFDANRFEQQAELLVSVVDQIFKIKAKTDVNERKVMEIEGEWNEQSGKAYAKINGERVNGQAVFDLVRKTGELSVEADHKQTIHHVTRVAKTGDNYYALESMTTRKSRPVFKLSGKVSSKVFEPEHLFSRRRGQGAYAEDAHLSTFEAVIYEPKEIRASGQFDCEKKEARVVFKNADDKQTQETLIRFDDATETIFVASQLSSQHEGQIYAAKAKINLPGLYQAEQCAYSRNSCQSEIVYSDNKSGMYAVQYYPGQAIAVKTPRGQTSVNLAY